ncbi:TIGR00730 family Rossman fold protein [Mucilaginibacter sp. 14171R-50]|uniref:LOG family protein n=1 Tax=Mucilaginibacter sp. 14171R-50 TaxID=2703789 RepID=UPI00138BEA91|nr:TIGR00730 family Rossman fold protein [Mucilaginibacter sp. 14171R-50]QHS56998.1 TIGR00730 family Rossman fold protein [Mucilaginibacter sp. 14171R-50]
MRSLCIFCGANFNGDPVLKQAIEILADVMVSKKITLIYGGGNVGIMGLLADAVMGRGGEVIGVMPKFLIDKEVGHTGITKLHIVDNMHQRKQMMNDLCDGIMMLPGGIGTLEEFFEVLTWLQLGLHNNPVGILNVNGFYDLLLQQMDAMVEQRYLKPANRKLILTSADPIELVNLMDNIIIKPEEVWFKDRNLT